MATPFNADPVASVEAAKSPRTISAKYSAGPKWNANVTMTGATSIIRRMPMLPPMNDATVVMNRATPALPCLDIG